MPDAQYITDPVESDFTYSKEFCSRALEIWNTEEFIGMIKREKDPIEERD